MAADGIAIRHSHRRRAGWRPVWRLGGEPPRAGRCGRIAIERNAARGGRDDTAFGCQGGAEGGIRTRTPVRTADFKSAASALPPLRRGQRTVPVARGGAFGSGLSPPPRTVAPTTIAAAIRTRFLMMYWPS